MKTEAEAKKCWCPFARPVFQHADDCGYVPGNRNFVPSGQSQITEQTQCIASECMAWRWVTPNIETFGYCGLAGKP